MTVRLVRYLRRELGALPGIVGEPLGRRGTWWREMKVSTQKSHVSPSKHKTPNPSLSTQFSMVNWAQDDRKGGTPSIWNETHIDIFGDDDEWGRQLVRRLLEVSDPNPKLGSWHLPNDQHHNRALT